jgi:hypothetical protein
VLSLKHDSDTVTVNKGGETFTSNFGIEREIDVFSFPNDKVKLFYATKSWVLYLVFVSLSLTNYGCPLSDSPPNHRQSHR